MLAGLSVGLTTVPQSLGLAILAGVQPIVGLYTSVFPAFIYFFFTSTRHVSIGTMALGSLIISSCIQSEMTDIEEMIIESQNLDGRSIPDTIRYNLSRSEHPV